MPALPDAAIAQAAEWLCGATRPVLLMGRVSRDAGGWAERVKLAETINAEVLTDLKVGAAFPASHPLHAAPCGMFLSPASMEVLRGADVVLSLDWLDLAGTLKQARASEPIASRIIQVSVDQYSHNGWSMDHQGLPPVDLFLLSEPEPVITLLNKIIKPRQAAKRKTVSIPAVLPTAPADGSLTVSLLAAALKRALKGEKVSLVRLPLSWSGDMWGFKHPLDFLGYDGGGGVGSGPGIAIGSALALKGGDRLPVAVIGDGDYMMGVNALWTASNARKPLLTIVCNNRSFFNDELHQERVARERGRPVENRWIGQQISDPAPDLAMMARGQGMTGIGPIETASELDTVLAEAIKAVRAGAAVVVDVIVKPGYSPSMTAALTRAN